MVESWSEPVQRFRVLQGLCSVYNIRAEYQTAFDIAEELLVITRRERQPELLAAAHNNLGNVSYWLGKFVSARTYLEETITLFNTQQNWLQDVHTGQDYGVGSITRSADHMWKDGW